MPDVTPYDRLLETSSGLRKVREGLWSSSAAEVSTSFSPQTHDACFQVEDGSFWFRHRNTCIISMVERHPPAGVILDIGGGNGFVTQALRKAGFSALVVEPGLEGAQNALSRNIVPVIHSSWEAAGFPPGAVSAVGLFDVLEHLEDDVGFLTALAAWLAPGARLYFTVPAMPSLWSHEDESAGHFRRYVRSTLKAVLTRAGFELDFVSSLFAPLPPAIFLARRLGGPDRPARDDHSSAPSLARRGLEAALSLEASAVRRGYQIPFGSSLFGTAHLEHR